MPPTHLVLLLPVVVPNWTQHLALYQHVLEEGVETLGELPGHGHGILSAELPNVVAGRDIVHYPQVPLYVSRLILGAAEGKEHGGRAHIAHHAFELSLPGKLVLLGAPH